MAGRDVWRKADADGDSRKFGLGIFDAIARGLDIDALRPPPHPGGGEKKQIEARRLAELGAQRVCVPRVLGERASTLLLSNLDDTFAAQLRAADGDGARINALTTAVIDAIADTHARSAYLGQPLPRNIMLDDSSCVGFIDFEEDPLEVMSLPQAQARDWLMFAFDMTKYYDGRTDVLADMLSRVMRRALEVAAHAGRVGRLEGFAQCIGSLGRSALHVAHSIPVVHAATLLTMLLVVAVLWNWLEDGEIELLRMMF